MSQSPFAPRQLWSIVLPALYRASPPLIQTCVTLSSILRRSLLSPLLSKACAPDPSSFPPGRAIVSIVITVEEGQPPIPRVQSNTQEIPPHTKRMVQHFGHALVPLLNKILVSSPLLQHTPFMLHPSGARKPLVLSIFGHLAHLDRPLTRPRHLRAVRPSNRLPAQPRVH